MMIKIWIWNPILTGLGVAFERHHWTVYGNRFERDQRIVYGIGLERDQRTVSGIWFKKEQRNGYGILFNWDNKTNVLEGEADSKETNEINIGLYSKETK